MTKAAQPSPTKHRGSLLAYRIMAFTTGVVLIAGTISLIVQEVGDVDSIRTGVGLLWVAHGYLYLVYLITTVNLGIRMRWHLIRMVLVAAAGTIPTMSFVAEHFVTRHVRAQLATAPADATAR